MMKKFLEYVYQLIRHRAYWIVGVTLILCVLSLFYVSDINIKSSFLDLLPQNDPLVQEYQYREQTIGNTEYLTILLSLPEEKQIPKDAGKAKLLEVAGKIKQGLIDSPEIESVRYRQEQAISEQFAFLYAFDESKIKSLGTHREELNALKSEFTTGSQLEPDLAEAYGSIAEKVKVLSGSDSTTAEDSTDPDQLFEEFSQYNKKVINTLDNLGAIPEVNRELNNFLEDLELTSQEVKKQTSSGYFSKDGTMLLMNAKPRYPSQRGVAYSKKITRIAERTVSHYRTQDIVGEEVSVQLTGPYVIASQTDQTLKLDMLTTTLISSIGILVVFFFGLGSKLYSSLIILPLGIALLFTFAWTKFSVGGFNLITSFLPALVLGLGIDYGIHILVRYGEERSRHVRTTKALKTTLMKKGSGTLLAAVTTSFVFTSLLFSQSKGFVEMGIITSVGILVSFLVYVFVLPSLLIIYQRWFQRKSEVQLFDYREGLKKIVQWAVDRKRFFAIGIAVLTCIAGFQASQLEFQFVSGELAPKVESIKTSQKVQEQFSPQATSMGPMFIFFPDNEKQLISISSKLQNIDQVTKINSIETYLPEDMNKKIESLNELSDISSAVPVLNNLKHNLENRDVITQKLERLIRELSSIQFSLTTSGRSERLSQSNQLLNQLAQIRKRLQSLDTSRWNGEVESLIAHVNELEQRISEVKKLPKETEGIKGLSKVLPESITSMFTTPQGEYIIYASVRGSIYKPDVLDNFVKKIEEFTDDYFGTPLIQYRLEHYMRRDFWVSTGLAALIIMFVLWRGIGNIKEALLVVIPLVLSYVWMLGGMRTFGLNFNFINLTISPLLIGVGIDNGLHLLYRWREERAAGDENVIAEVFSHTGLAIVMTSLTTITVFASLLIARTPGLRILGFSALLGVGFNMVFSLTALPVALALAFPKRDQYNSRRNDS